MSDLREELMEIRKQDPAAADVLDFYDDVEKVYQETLRAMGVVEDPYCMIGNSSSVTVSVQEPSLSAYYYAERKS
ncbi:MAG: hypothetical protein AABN34_25315 [Acidobacteriota bacterium]